MVKGTVKFFNEDKGYGFIERDDDEDEDVFFHVSELQGFEPEEGDEVEFGVEQGDRGPRAAHIKRA